MSGPERTMYIETRKFRKMLLIETKQKEYSEREAADVFNKVVYKYKTLSEKDTILICLRDREHNLIKSELIK